MPKTLVPIMLGLAFLGAFVSVYFHVPTWVVTVTVMAVALGLVALQILRAQRRQSVENQAVPAPELDSLVQQALARIGRPHVPFTFVSGGLFIKKAEGRLRISPKMLDLLPPGELDALLLFEVEAPPNASLLIWVETLAGPVLIAALLALLSWTTGKPLYTQTLLLCGLFVIAAQGFITGRAARRAVRPYVRAGGEPGALVAGLARMHSYMLWGIPEAVRPQQAAAARSYLQRVVQAAGLPPDYLRSAVDAVGGPPELHRPGRPLVPVWLTVVLAIGLGLSILAILLN